VGPVDAVALAPPLSVARHRLGVKQGDG
jgi:hypothetical protein